MEPAKSTSTTGDPPRVSSFPCSCYGAAMRLTVLAVPLFLLAACGSESPDDGKCYQETPQGRIEVACPDDKPAHAAPLCVTPGGESVVPVASCTWAAPTPVTPYALVYGTASALQTCDVYAGASPTGDADVMIVSSGFTGGSRTTAKWITWAQHRASLGHVAAVCDVRHSAAGGVAPFPAPNSDARCAFRTVSGIAPTGHVKGFGASAGAALADYADATADRVSLTQGATTVTLDDGTCSLAWSSADAAIVTRMSLWSEPGDLRVKLKIQNSAQPNMDLYLNLPTGESDPAWPTLSALASPSLWYRPGMAPRLMVASAGDFVVYPEQSIGSGAAGLTCTSVHPVGLTGTMPATRAVGVNATAIINACPSTEHLPDFAAPLTSGECTADVF